MPYADPEKQREYQRNFQRKWRAKNPDKIRKIQRKTDFLRRWDPNRIAQSKKAKYRQHHRNKIKVMEMYGKECCLCGIDKYETLCVDHIKNNGAEHRRSVDFKKRNRGGMWGILAKTEYRPDLYRILCHNCNMAREKYKIGRGFDYMPFEYWKQMSEMRKKANNA